MDVYSKIFSYILNNRLYKLLEKHGIKTQFDATPGVRCADGSFTPTTLLQQRKQHNLMWYVVFADLVKPFDKVNHDLPIEILERYGAPPKIRLTIKPMYTDLTVCLTFEKKVAEISQTVGVRQGDKLLPLLFLFFMSVFSKSLETEWRQSRTSTAQFIRVSVDDKANDQE